MPDGPEQISQDEIEALLRQAQSLGPASDASPSSPAIRSAPLPDYGDLVQSATASRPAARTMPDFEVPPNDVELLLRQAEEALASVDAPAAAPLSGAAPFRLPDFGGTPASTEKATLELLRDVELELKIELGRTQMYLEEVLGLRKGSVVPLDKLAGDPVDVYVNGRLIARGEVLVLNDNFCVRVAELIAGEEP
jgi:flagellar motor switch protein FliN/FliY